MRRASGGGQSPCHAGGGVAHIPVWTANRFRDNTTAAMTGRSGRRPVAQGRMRAVNHVFGG